MKKKLLFISAIALITGFTTGCGTTYMPVAETSKSDMTAEQSRTLSTRKIHVPCRVEVHCADSLVGLRDSFFFTDIYYYPLQEILTNSFRSAAFKVFDTPGGEVIDAFTLHVTVPESNLDIAWGKANYLIHVIVRFNEPGEKKVVAKSFKKHVQLPLNGNNHVPESVYKACRDIAFEALRSIVRSPKVQRTVKRFEDR